jgi:hypothetical protein
MNIKAREIIEQKVQEGLSIENQLGYYRLIKYGMMKQGKYDEASELRELDKECVRMLKEIQSENDNNIHDGNHSANSEG